MYSLSLFVLLLVFVNKDIDAVILNPPINPTYPGRIPEKPQCRYDIKEYGYKQICFFRAPLGGICETITFCLKDYGYNCIYRTKSCQGHYKLPSRPTWRPFNQENVDKIDDVIY